MPEHNQPRNGGAKTMEKFFIRLGPELYQYATEKKTLKAERT
jgi:hypothetical protein